MNNSRTLVRAITFQTCWPLLSFSKLRIFSSLFSLAPHLPQERQHPKTHPANRKRTASAPPIQTTARIGIIHSNSCTYYHKITQHFIYRANACILEIYQGGKKFYKSSESNSQLRIVGGAEKEVTRAVVNS